MSFFHSTYVGFKKVVREVREVKGVKLQKNTLIFFCFCERPIIKYGPGGEFFVQEGCSEVYAVRGFWGCAGKASFFREDGYSGKSGENREPEMSKFFTRVV